MTDFESMTKDELAAYAKDNFDAELVKRRSHSELVSDVRKLVNGEKLDAVKKAVNAGEKPMPAFLRHPTNGRVFEATADLMSRGDMIPCDAEGNNV